jgi:hypothetical protein
MFRYIPQKQAKELVKLCGKDKSLRCIAFPGEIIMEENVST